MSSEDTMLPVGEGGAPGDAKAIPLAAILYRFYES